MKVGGPSPSGPGGFRSLVAAHIGLEFPSISGGRLSRIGHKLNRRTRMTRPPNRYRPTDALSIAEAVFKPATPPAAETVRAQRKAAFPSPKSWCRSSSTAISSHICKGGPGWQEQINEALRRATGLSPAGGQTGVQRTIAIVEQARVGGVSVFRALPAPKLHRYSANRGRDSGGTMKCEANPWRAWRVGRLC